MILHPEEAARRDLRDAAIEAEIESFARTLCDEPEMLLEWLDEQCMGLIDIRVHSPSGVGSSADTALLRAALDSERNPATSCGWIMEQIQKWLMARPEMRKHAIEVVDEALAPGRKAP